MSKQITQKISPIQNQKNFFRAPYSLSASPNLALDSSCLQSSSPSPKLPKIYNKIHYNTIQPTKNSTMHKKSLSTYEISSFQPSKYNEYIQNVQIYKYLSSKVDFFNEQNQRRLKLKKRKKMIDMGVEKDEKEKAKENGKWRGIEEEMGKNIDKSRGKIGAGMVQLLHEYLVKRSNSERKNQGYYVIGKEA